MTGVFPLTFAVEKKPQGHGYTILEVDKTNPYFGVGEVLHGHEFHYSRIADWKEDQVALTFKVRRGHGIDGRRDGLCYKNVLAIYSHVHVSGTKGWAPGLFGQAVAYQDIPFCGRQIPDALNF